AVGLEHDQLHLERQVVLQIGADLLIGALGVGRHAFEMPLGFRVVVDLEVVGLVDVPVELVVVNQVLAVVGNKRRPLRGGRSGEGGQGGGGHERGDSGTGKGTSTPGNAHGHGQYLGNERRKTRSYLCRRGACKR